MTVIDITSLVLIGLSVLWGLAGGATTPIATAIGAILGWLVVAPLATAFVSNLTLNIGIDQGLLRGITYGVVVFTLAVLGVRLGRRANFFVNFIPGINAANWFGGAVIGFFIGLIAVGVAVLVLSQVAPAWTQDQMAHSTVAAVVGRPLALLGSLLGPPEIRDTLNRIPGLGGPSNPLPFPLPTVPPLR